MLKNLDDYFLEVTQLKQVVGSWGFNSNINFTGMSAEENNVWFFEQAFNFLRSFFGLVVPDNLEIITYNATQHIQKKNLEQQTFLDELSLILKNLKEPIWCFRLNLNIVGFLRTQQAPDAPIRFQIQEPCSFILWGGPDETGFQTFSISFSLFSNVILEGEHQQLWAVNQPILQKAIQKWESQSGHVIDSMDSNSSVGLYRHGFLSPNQENHETTSSQEKSDENFLFDKIPEFSESLENDEELFLTNHSTSDDEPKK